MQVNPVGNTDGILKDIYIIRNDINDKVYIGQAINSKNRFINHCKPSSHDGLIDKEINSLGKEHFWYEIIESQIPNYNDRERFWIKEYDSKYPNGYNIADGGNEPPTFYGLEHPLSNLTVDQLRGIKEDLKNTRMSLMEIASKYNSNKRIISRINQGLTYEEIGEKYPIREVPNMNGILTEENINDIIEILKYSYRNYDEIGEQYGVNGSTIKQINSGLIHKKDDESYPIRKYKNSGKSELTYEQVTELSELLLSTKISCNQLAKQFNVPLNTIYCVNNGTSKRYKRDYYKYPLRKRNPKM